MSVYLFTISTRLTLSAIFHINEVAKFRHKICSETQDGNLRLMLLHQHTTDSRLLLKFNINMYLHRLTTKMDRQIYQMLYLKKLLFIYNMYKIQTLDGCVAFRSQKRLQSSLYGIFQIELCKTMFVWKHVYYSALYYRNAE